MLTGQPMLTHTRNYNQDSTVSRRQAYGCFP
jgi:hypothetical protein